MIGKSRMNIFPLLKRTRNLIHFSIVVLFTIEVSAQAPTSQPSQKQNEFPKTSCSEIKAGAGLEGYCSVETPNGTWETGYYREGIENRKKTGTIKNLVILFH